MIIDGKAAARKIRDALASEIRKNRYSPRLDVILVGNNPASKIYVTNKSKACGEAGIKSVVHHLPEDASHDELMALIKELNVDPEVNGFFTQLPLPKHLSSRDVIEHTNPKKD